jgi:hypothetical protein
MEVVALAERSMPVVAQPAMPIAADWLILRNKSGTIMMPVAASSINSSYVPDNRLAAM